MTKGVSLLKIPQSVLTQMELYNAVYGKAIACKILNTGNRSRMYACP